MAYVSQGKENSSPQHQQEYTKATAQIFSDNRETSNPTPSLQAMMANSPQQQKLKSTAKLMANSPAQQRLNTTAQSFANKPESIQRMEDEEPLQAKFESEPTQLEAAPEAPRPNNTGLPDNLKSGIENLSGMSMDHVKVHYNSDKPAQLQAHAYAQGSEIHVAPGQEQHLPHEAWHVVQQAQGRVKPTMQMKGNVQVNDDVGLEAEADLMGERALEVVGQLAKQENGVAVSSPSSFGSAVQRATYTDINTMWETEFNNQTWLDTKDKDLLGNYSEAEEQLSYVDFLNTPGRNPEVDPNVIREDGRSTIRYDRTNPDGWDPHYFVAAIIHELIHVANLRKYEKNTTESDLTFANLHLPVPEGKKGGNGLTPNQQESLKRQIDTLNMNWLDLDKTLEEENKKKVFTDSTYKHLYDRIQYAGGKPTIENDTVLFDINYYMVAKNLTNTDTYALAKRMLKEATARRNTPGSSVGRVEANAFFFQIWKW